MILIIVIIYFLFSNMGVIRNYSSTLFKNVDLSNTDHTILNIPVEFSSSIIAQRLVSLSQDYPDLGIGYYSSLLRWFPRSVYDFKTFLSPTKEININNYLNTRSSKNSLSKIATGIGYSYTVNAYNGFYFLGSIIGTLIILITLNLINNFYRFRSYYLSQILLSLSGFSILLLRSSYNGLFTSFFCITFVFFLYFITSLLINKIQILYKNV